MMEKNEGRRLQQRRKGGCGGAEEYQVPTLGLVAAAHIGSDGKRETRDAGDG